MTIYLITSTYKKETDAAIENEVDVLSLDQRIGTVVCLVHRITDAVFLSVSLT